MDGAEFAKIPNGSLLFIRLTEGGHMLQARISEMSKDFILWWNQQTIITIIG